MRLRPALVIALALLLTSAAGTARAHVELVDADPGADEVVDGGRTHVELRLAGFDPSQPVAVEVTDSAGDDVTDGEPEVDVDTSTVRVPTLPLEAGLHQVDWQAQSDDGDGPAEGSYAFTVRGEADTGWGIWLVWFFALAIPAAIFLRPGARKKRRG